MFTTPARYVAFFVAISRTTGEECGNRWYFTSDRETFTDCEERTATRIYSTKTAAKAQATHFNNTQSTARPGYTLKAFVEIYG